MKSAFKLLFFLILLYAAFFIYDDLITPIDRSGHFFEQKVIKQDRALEVKLSFFDRDTTTDETLEQLIGKPLSSLLEAFGDPIQSAPSRYDYQWYLFTDEEDYFYQFGIKDDQVVTAYITGEQADIFPLEIGMNYEEVEGFYAFQQEVEFDRFSFHLSEQDIETTPIIILDEGILLQLYFDIHTGQLSSIRIMNEEVAVKHQPYYLSYTGPLPKKSRLSNDDWEMVTQSEAYAIFVLTNMIRKRFEVNPLQWHDQASQVASLHSQDMHQLDYFSHQSQDGRDLLDRLTEGEVPFSRAGENIAAQYTDGLAAVEGWLNSEGHRRALLDESFTHLGVGVYQNYYTQNFITDNRP
ncbi:CAP domain-containing protein [Amphibacillus cookii]|uniref:CAP domain-containing protein n=1 Tax=Amphibacillus cookii TaxID=767787 RepID=UPI00195B3FB0|nr:CAP domain-containing protein [Amphibacillus cookii]MBM7540455.1 uncharacterized protein YkwD [Amphibacillus cookii]